MRSRPLRYSLFTLAFALLTWGAKAQTPTRLSLQVGSSADDVEESVTGVMDLTSTDLELVDDGTRSPDQLVGMRFTNVTVPKDAYIVNAYIQFTVDELDNGQTDLVLLAEASDNAAAFTATNQNLSGRAATAATVNWDDVDAWTTVGDAGKAQKTPNLASLVSEVTQRSGWQSGNAMVFIVDGDGERSAESYDGDANAAPKLVIEYIPTKSIVVSISTGLDDVEEANTGTVYTNSSDLELVDDGFNGPDQKVGLRFNNITVPGGAVVVNSYIQFTVDETDNGATNLSVKAEAIDNAPAFAATANNVSTRNTTSAIVKWDNVAAWSTVGDAGLDQQTPNLSSVVTEIVERPGWVNGNSMVFIITGTGERTAEAYEGSSSRAAKLVIQYLEPKSTTAKITASSDDAEERGPNATSGVGVMDLTSSDIELVRDGNDGDQYCGFRFNNISIPRFANIANAYIQFTVDEDDLGNPFEIYFKVEDSDNPSTFGSTQYNISSRKTMSDSVVWKDAPTWTTVGASGQGQKTPNLAKIIQQVVDRKGWNSGNSISILVHGVGERVAESYDGSSNDAPVLNIEYYEAQSTDQQIAAGVDDVEEQGAGSMYLNSSDIELGFDGGTQQTAGLRFNDLNIPPGAKVKNAYIQFTVDETNSGTTNIKVRGEFAGDAIPFTSAAYSLTGRDKTQNVVAWNSIPAWTSVWTAGADQQSPNLSDIIQEIIGHEDWQSGNSMVFMLDGTGERTAEAYEGSSSRAAKLFVTYTFESTKREAPIGSFPVAKESVWKFNDQGQNLDTSWYQVKFNDSQWDFGKGELGYGDQDENTVLNFGGNANSKFPTYYFRHNFIASKVIEIDSLILKLKRDDGAIVYLNGHEIVRSNMKKGKVTYDSLAAAVVGGSDEQTYFEYRFKNNYLVEGMNVLAVEVHQNDTTSSDLSFDLSLEGTPYLPSGPRLGCVGGNAHIGCFTSVTPTAQVTRMVYPETHAFQLIFKQGETYTKGGGTVPGNHDFTGYVPMSKSSRLGHVMVNHETSPGGVSVLDVRYDSLTRLWAVDTTQAIDFSGVAGTARNCSGGVTPWETSITSEETGTSNDANNDGYFDLGWNVELDPVKAEVVQKLWAMGNMSHENVVVAEDSLTAYYGEDAGDGTFYKFVADNKMDLSTGKLYTLKLDKPMSGGEPQSSTGTWVLVPNTTPADRNSTTSLAQGLGATLFAGVEDAEIGPHDGKVYFTAKGWSRVYRFEDKGAAVEGFETYIGGKTYNVHDGQQVNLEPWGGGNDNLVFDDKGNLWVQQDGSRDHLWMVRPDHRQFDPRVELFATTPFGCEPTGATFTPDYKFMFISMQHPSGINQDQVDATGKKVAINASATLVVARKEHLGDYSPRQVALNVKDTLLTCNVGLVSWTNGSGESRLVIAKEGSDVDALPEVGQAYRANGQFGKGQELGNGNFVVYNGTANITTLYGLEANKNYHLAVFEYNLVNGWQQVYQVDTFATKVLSTPELVADFSIVALEACEDANEFEFENSTLAQNAGTVTYLWSLGDGTTITTKDVKYSYATKGAYTVQLTARSSIGCVSTVTKVATVKESPVVGGIGGRTLVNANSFETYTVTNFQGASYTWSVQGGIVNAGQGTNTVTIEWGAIGTGTLSVVATKDGCVSNQADVTVDIQGPIGIDGVERAAFSIYPNPAKEDQFVVVKLDDNQGKFDVSIYNNQGKLVKEQTEIWESQYELELNGLAPGVYMLKVNQAGKINSQKLIIE